jgi:hypothetical protein
MFYIIGFENSIGATMTKYLLLGFLLIFAQAGHAHDHSVGVHGMVLMPVGERIFASHMPLHHSKHAHQIVLELDVAGEAKASIMRLLNKHQLITLMPETFSLSELQNGQLKQFNGVVYSGHFERKGTVAFKNVLFKVKKQWLNQPLVSKSNGVYYVLDINQNQSLLVHQIGNVPSFDQILLVSPSTGKALISPVDLANKQPLKTVIEGLNIEKSLYLETQDFAQ